MSDSGTVQRLHQHVQQLAGVIGERNVRRPQALQAAQDYLVHTWQEHGHAVTPLPYTVDNLSGVNLEVTCRGSRFPDQLILVGAHYDTVLGCPGANDNGSGLAVLLELSRMLRWPELARSVRLVAFAHEEAPFFFSDRQGSLVYARAAKQRGDDIRLMIALETMACFSDVPGSQHYPPLLRHFYPDRGDFIALVSNLRSRRAMRRLAAAFRQASDFPLQHIATLSLVPGVAWSDHLSFWRQGYPALMVTDTAFYRYPYYHTPEDTPDKLDYPRLAAVTHGLAGAIRRLADEGV
jgi:Zn-dependent M28 family amino/carboxypeptidase